jgi:hypothetical protein
VKKIKRCDTLIFKQSDDVERNVTGMPIAFRIWHAGSNMTDHGDTVFSPRSADLLMTEQENRGNLYSIDVDHLSLNPMSPIDVRKAVGWHQLEVRDGDLWAVNVEWTDTVRDGLTKDPPEWRYFSPAYDCDPETNEVVSYLNTALTNNPATHSVTALASRAGVEATNETRRDGMKYHEVLAELARMAREGDGEDAEAARKALKSMLPKAKSADAGDDGGDGDEAPPSSKAPAAPPPKKEAEDKKDAADDADKKDAKDDADDEDTKAAARAASRLASLEARNAALEARFEAEDRKAIYATRKDLGKETIAMLDEFPLEKVKRVLAAIPVTRPNPAAADHVTATRGKEQGTGPTVRPELAEEIDRGMGLYHETATVKHAGVHSTYAVMNADEAKTMLASLTAKKESGK